MSSRRIIATLLLPCFLCFVAMAKRTNFIVADSTTRLPLPSASFFDKNGKTIGISNSKGTAPYISRSSYPITVRYLGYKERILDSIPADTVFLPILAAELPEVVIETRHHKVLHILAYVREVSTLTTFTDTVFLFREKMVDYMIPHENGIFNGWLNPRILKSQSYYRFTNSEGLDSVSGESNNHFSWSDWIGIPPAVKIIDGLLNDKSGTDTIKGKYSPTEIWNKQNDKVSVDINILADTSSRKWVPNLSNFFKKNIEFENFKLRYNYDNVRGDTIRPAELSGYSFTIESNGRGRNMFRFNRKDEPFFVSTYTEIYILDKEYITVKEANKWVSLNKKMDDVDIFEPQEAPELQKPIRDLIARVESLDKNNTRLDAEPDHRMISTLNGSHNFKIGKRALILLKQFTGITYYKAHRNFNRKWSDFRKQQLSRNSE